MILLFHLKISKRLIDYGIDYTKVDYYDRTPYQNISLKDNFFSRYNNNI